MMPDASRQRDSPAAEGFRKAGALLGLAAIAGVAVVLWLAPGRELVEDFAGAARNWGVAGVGLFVAAYVASTVAFIPGSWLTLTAGFLYGPFWGLVVASPASVAGATAAFLLGRTLLRDWAERRIGSSSRARALNTAVAREGFMLVLLLRLSPLFPFNVLNYALSLTEVRLRTYVLASFIGMLPATALYVYLGSLVTVAAQLRSGVRSAGTTGTWLTVVGIAATLGVVLVGARVARRALADQMGGDA
jgi:uncharacterized membrane protein YdjX (TVP38/TMEM64 family)